MLCAEPCRWIAPRQRASALCAGGVAPRRCADAGVCWAPQVVSRQGDVPGIDFRTIAVSVLIYLGAPLAAAIITRYLLIAVAGARWFNQRFLPAFGPVALLALVYTARPAGLRLPWECWVPWVPGTVFGVKP